MSRRILGPFNRVEGDLEVEVEVTDGVVSNAWVNSPLYRGFERILLGKDPRDALVYTPRICGICSISQSVAAATAIASAQGIEPLENGRTATNLLLACENLADHLSHFYLFFMPNFASKDYAKAPWFEEISTRFAAQKGRASAEALPARAAFLNITGILAGKWPHSLSIQPGGTTRNIELRERIQLLMIVGSFRNFLETVLFAASLEEVNEIESAEALDAFVAAHPLCDFSRFMQLADILNLSQLGKATDRFMSFGAYGLGNNDTVFAQGVQTSAGLSALNTLDITEDISHSWLSSQSQPKHPFEGTTHPDADVEGYSWCKAPRLAGQVVEVGALSRQLVNQNPLFKDLVANDGGNVKNRIIARLFEMALMVPKMEQWITSLDPKERFCHTVPVPKEGEGVGLVEAARGGLGHWIQIRKGKISNYQIVAPTTWNFSPRDHLGVPGPLEQALIGTSVGAEGGQSIEIQHVVRSFDPCMVCTVH